MGRRGHEVVRGEDRGPAQLELAVGADLPTAIIAEGDSEGRTRRRHRAWLLDLRGSKTVSGLVQNSKYCFYIVTTDAAGNAANSAASARITAN